MKKVLIFLTNHATLGDTDEANGTFAPELTHALHEILDAGMAYELASIEGGPAPLYGADAEDDKITAAMMADKDFQQRLGNTTPVAEINIDDFDAIFYPGGFGLLSDLATNETVAAMSAQHYDAGGIIAAVCHGPAGLLPITLSSGKKLLASKSVTGFTREEEIDYGTIDKVPFLLEESLARGAARYNKVPPWGEFVVEDGRVITGQNPASAGAVARALVRQL